MVIVVNTRLLLKERLEGIGWFTCETLKRITRDHPGHRFIFLFDRPYSEEFVFSGNVTPVVVSPPTRHPLLWFLWFEFRIPGILKKYGADLFLSPDGYLSLRSSVPQLPVMHDLNFVHRPRDLPRLTSAYYNHYFPRFAKKAVRIATVSEWSKKDISESFGIPPEKIDVVYNGCKNDYKPIGEAEKKDVKERYTGGNPYFLFVGALHPRKNIEGLLEAFEEFKMRSSSPVKLLIVGGKMFKTGKITERFHAMKYREEVVFTGRVSEAELRRIYGAALALTFVPFFEGFGIPVVEAMGAGIPVICSGTTSLPEVGGDAVRYTDPAQSGQIASAMLEIFENAPMRNILVEKGFQQKEKFTWEKSAELLWGSILKATRG